MSLKYPPSPHVPTSTTSPPWYIPKSHSGSICTYGQGTKNTCSQYYLHLITYNFNKEEYFSHESHKLNINLVTSSKHVNLNILFITQKIANALDDKHDACIVFLDVSKAFDKVWHKCLLFKLNQMGITGNALKWIESYLSDIFQRVVVNGCSSQWLYTNSGVPQGSILGPLFFLVYINDLVLHLECDVHLFADDTSLLDCFDDSAKSNGKICRDLEKIERWSVLWKVTFNANKTRYMIITRKNNYLNYPPIYLHNTSIERTDQYTHLALVFTSNFKWNKHIEKCIFKAS